MNRLFCLHVHPAMPVSFRLPYHPYVKPKKAETDRICEIMNTSIVGWKQGTMTRFKDYGTQRSWVCVNENCKRDAKDLKNENDWHPVTEEEARQMELSFQ